MKLIGLILLSLIAFFFTGCAQPVAGSGKVEVYIDYMGDAEVVFPERALTQAELSKITEFLDRAETTRSTTAKTPPPDHVTLHLDTRKFRCGIDGTWMVDFSSADDKYEYMHYKSKDGAAIWSVDKKTGELTFVD